MDTAICWRFYGHSGPGDIGLGSHPRADIVQDIPPPPGLPIMIPPEDWSVNGAIRIRWNQLTTSIFENTVEPPRMLSMGWIEGKGDGS